MSLLHDIQTAVLQDDSDIGPILLKLLLTARLGIQPFAEWVKHESEGYLRANRSVRRCTRALGGSPLWMSWQLTDSVNPAGYLKDMRRRDPSLAELFKGGANCHPPCFAICNRWRKIGLELQFRAGWWRIER